MSDVVQIHEGNRDAWNRTAKAGYGGEVQNHVERLRAGGHNLLEAERRILGDLEGRCDRAIHLQCSHGLDGLGLLNVGAQEVVGIDISEEMIALATEKSAQLNARAKWIRADILDTPHDLDKTADLVYTGRGALCWMMELDAWAAVVYRLLKPGGRLFLYEGHPLDFLWDENASTYKLRDGASYFQSRPSKDYGFPFGAASKVDESKPVNLTSRVWTIGETVTAIVKTGLRILHLEEVAEPFWDQFKHIPSEEIVRLPHSFALLAVKDEAPSLA